MKERDLWLLKLYPTVLGEQQLGGGVKKEEEEITEDICQGREKRRGVLLTDQEEKGILHRLTGDREELEHIISISRINFFFHLP